MKLNHKIIKNKVLSLNFIFVNFFFQISIKIFQENSIAKN